MLLANSDQTSLLSHPFFVITTLFSHASWAIALISQAFAVAKFGRSAVATLWLAILLQLFVNIGMSYSLLSNSVPLFRLQITVFSAMSVVLGALGIDNNIFSGNRSQDAVAAAWIMLLAVDLLWIIVLSSDRNSPILQVFAEEARIRLSSDSHSPTSSEEALQIHAPSPNGPFTDSKDFLTNPRNTVISAAPATPTSADTARPPLPPSNRLSAVYGVPERSSGSRPSDSLLMNDNRSHLTVPASTATRWSSNAPSSTYAYSQKALALYDYTATGNSLDVGESGEGELSFLKGDILHVSRTIDKKWWPARKPDGQVGVVPSNYLKIIQG